MPVLATRFHIDLEIITPSGYSQQQVTSEEKSLTVPSFCLMLVMLKVVSEGGSSRSRGERALVGLRMHSCTRSNTDDDKGHKGDHME